MPQCSGDDLDGQGGKWFVVESGDGPSTSGTVEVTITDDTQSGGTIQHTITYQAPFDKCDRVSDYYTAWAHFEQMS